MINIPKNWPIEDYHDCSTVNMWAEVQADQPELVELARAGIQQVARDHARTPMQWDSTFQAGFSSHKDTWMRVMDSYVDINVESQEKDEESPLAFYKYLLELRKKEKDLFVHGIFKLCDEKNEETMVYTKTFGGRTALVALSEQNFLCII